MKFWMRYDNLRGTMASEAVSEYEEVLMKLGLDQELAKLNKWRSKVPFDG